jgi:amino acid permease
MRFVKTQMKPGSPNASVFALVIVCLGAGTLTFPYVIYENGFFLGIALILFGGVISASTGFMIIYCVDQTKATCFEEIALACFNSQWQRFTSMCMIATNVGFTTSYFVLVSLSDNQIVQIVYALRNHSSNWQAIAWLV